MTLPNFDEAPRREAAVETAWTTAAIWILNIGIVAVTVLTYAWMVTR